MGLGGIFNLLINAQTNESVARQEATNLLREAHKVLAELDSLISDSRGIAGYHKNGDVAEWDEFDEFSGISELRERIENFFKSSEGKLCG